MYVQYPSFFCNAGGSVSISRNLCAQLSQGNVSFMSSFWQKTTAYPFIRHISLLLRPLPHMYVFMWKWRLLCSFSPSVHTQTLIQWRLSKTETFENAALSCGRAKTETFENGVDLKTYTCGRSLSVQLRQIFTFNFVFFYPVLTGIPTICF